MARTKKNSKKSPLKKSGAKKPRPKVMGTLSHLQPAAPDENLPRTLEGCREQIDALDEQIITLLDKRARVCRQVGALKVQLGAAAFDAGRHLQVLNSISKRGKGDFPREGLRTVYGEILSACLNLQAPQTIAFLGPEATYSHIAATRAFGRSAHFAPCETIGAIFQAVERHEAHFGIVPVENSTGGVIHVTLDELMTSELSICAEIYIPIRHNLLCLGPRAKIRRICSHPQVLLQCRNWLRENMAGVELVEVASSAEGATIALKNKGIATIGSRLAADFYKLPILESGIEDQKDNVTRFLVIGNQSPRPSGQDRTSVMFSIKDEPGALFHLLQPFANRKINLTKIESRPTRRRAWDYIFFLDIEGHITEKAISDAVNELRKHCTFLRVLGSYPVDRERDLGFS